FGKFRCQGVKLFFVHNKIPVSECIISETGIYTNCGRGSLKALYYKALSQFLATMLSITPF
ncbi:hypothetical protein ACN9OF_10190, partial [Glaesserella parasuis]|uniref:hypothetical protein n=1 Tax=Glaesserella parasuis TaxID=738 RepID=UPI003B673DB8